MLELPMTLGTGHRRVRRAPRRHLIGLGSRRIHRLF